MASLKGKKKKKQLAQFKCDANSSCESDEDLSSLKRDKGRMLARCREFALFQLFFRYHRNRIIHICSCGVQEKEDCQNILVNAKGFSSTVFDFWPLSHVRSPLIIQVPVCTCRGTVSLCGLDTCGCQKLYNKLFQISLWIFVVYRTFYFRLSFSIFVCIKQNMRESFLFLSCHHGN